MTKVWQRIKRFFSLRTDVVAPENPPEWLLARRREHAGSPFADVLPTKAEEDELRALKAENDEKTSRFLRELFGKERV